MVRREQVQSVRTCQVIIQRSHVLQKQGYCVYAPPDITFHKKGGTSWQCIPVKHAAPWPLKQAIYVIRQKRATCTPVKAAGLRRLLNSTFASPWSQSFSTIAKPAEEALLQKTSSASQNPSYSRFIAKKIRLACQALAVWSTKLPALRRSSSAVCIRKPRAF